MLPAGRPSVVGAIDVDPSRPASSSSGVEWMLMFKTSNVWVVGVDGISVLLAGVDCAVDLLCALVFAAA